jgi:hypothetical protein
MMDINIRLVESYNPATNTTLWTIEREEKLLFGLDRVWRYVNSEYTENKAREMWARAKANGVTLRERVIDTAKVRA